MSAQKWMLGSRGQKWLKGIHVTLVAFSVGAILSMLVLLLLKQNFKGGENLFLIDLGIFRLLNFLNYSFYGVMLTGLIYSLFTKWGFFRHHWITVKWTMVLLLFVFTWVWMGPAINGTVALADGGLLIPNSLSEYVNYTNRSLLYVLIECFPLVALLFISVLKPWGKRKQKSKMKRSLVFGIVVTLVMIMIAFLILNFLTLQKFRKIKIEDTDVSSLADGTYSGNAFIGGFTYKVQAIIQNHKIVEVKTIANRKSSYARFAEGVLPRILAAQNANVDTITGATTTSKALLKAVENAFRNKPKQNNIRR